MSSPEFLLPPDPPSTEATLPELHDYLREHAWRAYEGEVGASESVRPEQTFYRVNQYMATAVANEATLLAVRSQARMLGSPLSESQIGRMGDLFRGAAEDAGLLFRRVFDGLGSPQSYPNLYNDTVSTSGRISRRYLPQVLEAAGVPLPTPEVDEETGERLDFLEAWRRQVDFRDVLRVTAIHLNCEPSAYLETLRMDDTEVRDSLRESTRGDFFEEHVEHIPISNEIRPLVSADIRRIDLAVFLANAVWKHTQVHRARWEQTTARVDSDVRKNFDVLDLMRINEFARYQEEGLSPASALIRVAFELYKDIIQYAHYPDGEPTEQQIEARARREYIPLPGCAGEGDVARTVDWGERIKPLGSYVLDAAGLKN